METTPQRLAPEVTVTEPPSANAETTPFEPRVTPESCVVEGEAPREPRTMQSVPNVTSSHPPSANAGSVSTGHREAPDAYIEDGTSLSSTSDSEKADDPPGSTPEATTHPPRGLILKWFAADLQPPVQ